MSMRGRSRWVALGIVVAPAVARAQESAREPDPKEGGKKPDLELPAVLVTGSVGQGGVPVVPIDHPGSRDVLGPAEVRAIGARDLNDLLLYLPALSTRPYNGGEAAAPSFSIHGLPDDGLTEYVLPLIDGVPANPLPYGWTALSFFPLFPEQVFAIDLLRGGQAVRYSPNTVGGVLNLITRPIPDRFESSLQSTYGSFDAMSTVATIGDGSDPALGWLVTLGDRRGEGYREDGAYDQQSLEVKLRREHGPDAWTATRFSWFTDSHQAPGGLTVAEFAADRFGNARPEGRFDGFRAAFDVVHHRGNDDAWIEPYVAFSQTHRELTARRPLFGAPTEVRDWTDDSLWVDLGIRGERRFASAGGHRLHWGVRAHQEWLPDYEIVSTPFGGGATTVLQDSSFDLTSFSAHVDDTLEPLEGLELTAGVRAEWIPVADGDDEVLGGDFDDRFFTLLPGVSASWRVRDDWALFANWQRGFRAPQVWGFNLAAGAAAQDVDFEHGDSFEVGTRAELPGGIDGTVAAWRTDFDDVGVFYSGFYENIGRIVAHGVDATLHADAGAMWEPLAGFGAMVSASLQESELREGPFRGNETPYAWEHKAAWNFHYLAEGGLRCSLGGTYVGDSFSDEANTAVENANGNLGHNPSRTIWDAQVEKAWEREGGRTIRAALGASNLFDEEWLVHSRGGFFGGGKVAGAPRQLYLRLEFTF